MIDLAWHVSGVTIACNSDNCRYDSHENIILLTKYFCHILLFIGIGLRTVDYHRDNFCFKDEKITIMVQFVY